MQRTNGRAPAESWCGNRAESNRNHHRGAANRITSAFRNQCWQGDDCQDAVVTPTVPVRLVRGEIHGGAALLAELPVAALGCREGPESPAAPAEQPDPACFEVKSVIRSEDSTTRRSHLPTAASTTSDAPCSVELRDASRRGLAPSTWPPW